MTEARRSTRPEAVSNAAVSRSVRREFDAVMSQVRMVSPMRPAKVRRGENSARTRQNRPTQACTYPRSRTFHQNTLEVHDHKKKGDKATTLLGMHSSEKPGKGCIANIAKIMPPAIDTGFFFSSIFISAHNISAGIAPIRAVVTQDAYEKRRGIYAQCGLHLYTRSAIRHVRGAHLPNPLPRHTGQPRGSHHLSNAVLAQSVWGRADERRQKSDEQKAKSIYRGGDNDTLNRRATDVEDRREATDV